MNNNNNIGDRVFFVDNINKHDAEQLSQDNTNLIIFASDETNSNKGYIYKGGANYTKFQGLTGTAIYVDNHKLLLQFNEDNGELTLIDNTTLKSISIIEFGMVIKNTNSTYNTFSLYPTYASGYGIYNHEILSPTNKLYLKVKYEYDNINDNDAYINTDLQLQIFKNTTLLFEKTLHEYDHELISKNTSSIKYFVFDLEKSMNLYPMILSIISRHSCNSHSTVSGSYNTDKITLNSQIFISPQHYSIQNTNDNNNILFDDTNNTSSEVNVYAYPGESVKLKCKYTPLDSNILGRVFSGSAMGDGSHAIPSNFININGPLTISGTNISSLSGGELTYDYNNYDEFILKVPTGACNPNAYYNINNQLYSTVPDVYYTANFKIINSLQFIPLSGSSTSTGTITGTYSNNKKIKIIPINELKDTGIIIIKSGSRLTNGQTFDLQTVLKYGLSNNTYFITYDSNKLYSNSVIQNGDLANRPIFKSTNESIKIYIPIDKTNSIITPVAQVGVSADKLNKTNSTYTIKFKGEKNGIYEIKYKEYELDSSISEFNGKFIHNLILKNSIIHLVGSYSDTTLNYGESLSFKFVTNIKGKLQIVGSTPGFVEVSSSSSEISNDNHEIIIKNINQSSLSMYLGSYHNSLITYKFIPDDSTYNILSDSSYVVPIGTQVITIKNYQSVPKTVPNINVKLELIDTDASYNEFNNNTLYLGYGSKAKFNIWANDPTNNAYVPGTLTLTEVYDATNNWKIVNNTNDVDLTNTTKHYKINELTGPSPSECININMDDHNNIYEIENIYCQNGASYTNGSTLSGYGINKETTIFGSGIRGTFTPNDEEHYQKIYNVDLITGPIILLTGPYSTYIEEQSAPVPTTPSKKTPIVSVAITNIDSNKSYNENNNTLYLGYDDAARFNITFKDPNDTSTVDGTLTITHIYDENNTWKQVSNSDDLDLSRTIKHYQLTGPNVGKTINIDDNINEYEIANVYYSNQNRISDGSQLGIYSNNIQKSTTIINTGIKGTFTPTDADKYTPVYDINLITGPIILLTGPYSDYVQDQNETSIIKKSPNVLIKCVNIDENKSYIDYYDDKTLYLGYNSKATFNAWAQDPDTNNYIEGTLLITNVYDATDNMTSVSSQSDMDLTESIKHYKLTGPISSLSGTTIIIDDDSNSYDIENIYYRDGVQQLDGNNLGNYAIPKATTIIKTGIKGTFNPADTTKYYSKQIDLITGPIILLTGPYSDYTP